jgi:aminoglycoside phosphotransferase (APT) family kinase protein
VEGETRLEGGNVSTVVRVGDTVRRSTGPWTPAVHDLLRHLEAVGFEYSPRVLGTDAAGREVLTFIEGETLGATSPWPRWAWSDATLDQAMAILREYHEAVRAYRPEGASRWRMWSGDAGEGDIICHNDFAPYNLVRRDGRIVGVIDWDLAAPGAPAWDLAFAAWAFAPISADADPLDASAPIRIGRRIVRAREAYGLEAADGFVALIKARMRASIDGIRARADAGDAAFRALIEGGHVDRMLRDLRATELWGGEWQAALDGQPSAR